MTEIIIDFSTDISSNSNSSNSSSSRRDNKKSRRHNKIHYVMRRHHQNDRLSSMLLLLLQVLLITVLTTTFLTTTKTKPNVGLFVNSFSSTSLSSTSSLSTVATAKGSQRQGGGGRLSSSSTSSIRSGILTLPIERTTTTTTRLHAASTGTTTISADDETDDSNNTKNIDFALQNGKFNLNTALFCAGLAFDSYVEPPQDSSRWERGSKGMNVAFVSSKYTRNLYRGMVEVTPIEATDLPEEDSSIESVATGNGVDVCIMCAVVEGKLWEDDIKMLDTDSNHNGIFSLSGAAHVGRSRTAWANINEQKSMASKTKKNVPFDKIPFVAPFISRTGSKRSNLDSPSIHNTLSDLIVAVFGSSISTVRPQCS